MGDLGDLEDLGATGCSSPMIPTMGSPITRVVILPTMDLAILSKGRE